MRGIIWSKCGHSLRTALILCLMQVLMHASGPAWAGADEPVSLPDARRAAGLVRATLLSLNEANLTGNYSVLRDASAPDFRRDFTEARLAETFAVLREKRLDLVTSAPLDPVIADASYIPYRNIVVYRGTVPVAASSMPNFDVNFNLAYQFVEGRWRLFTLDLSLDPAAGQPRVAGIAL
jgi:hypothetical protein